VKESVYMPDIPGTVLAVVENYQINVIIALLALLIIALSIVIYETIHCRALASQIESLRMSVNRLKNIGERRLFRELRNQPRARLLLEGPKARVPDQQTLAPPKD
jgi:hypothetical protein